MRLHRLRWATVTVAVLLSAFLLGCGSGTLPTTPEGFVTPTEHPLVAQYRVDAMAPARVWVEFGTDTTYGKQTNVVDAPNGYPNPVTILVAGMKADTEYHMRAHVEYSNGESWNDDDHTFKTGSLPANNGLRLAVTRPSGSKMEQSGVELLDLNAIGTDNLEAVVADLEGNIIWYYDIGSRDLWAFPLIQLPNGNFLVHRTGQVQRDGRTIGVHDLLEVGLAGNLVRELKLSDLNALLKAAGFPELEGTGSIHHDVAILPNGHWILLANTVKIFTDLPGYPGDTRVVGDVLIDLDPEMNVVWVWSAFDHLDVTRHLFGLPDWTHANAVIYSPQDGNLMVSMRHQGWILEIDYANGKGTGAVLWRLGNEGDFLLDGGDPSQWFYAQHYPHLEAQSGSQTTLSIFDNGDLRKDDTGNQCSGGYPSCYSRAVLMLLDDATLTASIIWQDMPGFYSFWGGSIGSLENGNMEFDLTAPFGGVPPSRILEVTQTPNPEVVWQMDVFGGFAYRGFRIPSLYPGVVWH